jgi:prepilin-type N-terminal cleavage/methylation domain-containing protein
MKNRAKPVRHTPNGFTLLELMLVVTILSVIIAAVFSQLNIAQTRLSTEETKLDDFQQARDFVDQLFRDINQIGTPNMQIMDTSSASFTPSLASQTSLGLGYTWANTYIGDNRFAIGLVKIDKNEIRFEGSMNGDGSVQSIIYKLNTSGSCTACYLQRSQADKTNGDPLNQSSNWGTEVNDVKNGAGGQIFHFFQYDGTEITTLPQDISTQAGATLLANVKTIQIDLTILNNAVTDKQTGQPIETNFEGEISLNNCSMAATGQNMSCQ